MRHTPSVYVVMTDCAELLALFYWLPSRFIKRLKRETMQRVFERKKEQDEAENEVSAIEHSIAKGIGPLLLNI